MLRRVLHSVQSVVSGSESRYRGGQLTLDLDDLRRHVLADTRLTDVQLDIVAPGEKTRVANVLDVCDARKKEQGPTFPGFDGPPVTAGLGTLHVLDGFQIIATGTLPAGEGGLMVTRRAFIDFWGEGATWSPLSSRPSLVLDFTIAPDVNDKAQADDAVRRATLTVSTAIGDLARESDDQAAVIQEITSASGRSGSDLPRVAYVYQVQSQGALVETFLYGVPVAGLYPTLLEPAEILDGAMVSGNHQRLTTPSYLHLNNPVVDRLIREDGERIQLLPVVLMEGHQISTPAKERGAAHAVQLLRILGAEGAIFTQEGGGMSMIDQMLTVEKAKAAGIECVAITFEMAGTGGDDRPLIHYTRAADHLVSTGNRDAIVTVEAPDLVLGRAGAIVGGGYSSEQSEQLDLSGSVDVPIWCLYGSTSQVGGGYVRGTAA